VSSDLSDVGGEKIALRNKVKRWIESTGLPLEHTHSNMIISANIIKFESLTLKVGLNSRDEQE